MVYSVKELQAYLEEVIEKEHVHREPEELYEPVSYLLSLGGKRMRPVLLLAACNLFSDTIQKAIDPAIGIELFHNFTLMHDDIMDDAPLRRGKPTVHTKYDGNTAILSGDAMFVLSCKKIMNAPNNILSKVLRIFNDTALEVCEGQQYDMNFESQEEVAIDSYLRMIELKTSVLLAASLQIGALIGGADDQAAELLYKFGRNIGISFQLQDDILDTFGDPDCFGKQVGGDIVQNKKTWLFIKAMEIADAEKKNKLTEWYSTNGSDPIEKVNAVKAIFEDLKVRDLAAQEMAKYHNMGMQALEQLDVDDSKKAVLKGIADKLMTRTV